MESALLRVMEAVDSSLDLKPVLYRLVEAAVEATGADRAAVFLVERGRLVPVAVAGIRINRDLFRRFRQMEPIDLEGVPARAALLGEELVVIDDAATNEIVPDEWVDVFGTTSVAIAALGRSGSAIPAGIVVVDHTTKHTFTARELDLVRAIAHAGRIAVANAELRARVERSEERQHRLVDGFVNIGSAVDARSVLGAIARSVSTVVPGRSCSISYHCDGSLLAVDGGSENSDGPRTVFPLRTSNGHRGHLTIHGGDLAPEEMALVDAFAQQASLAIERAQLVADVSVKLRRTELLYRLGDLLNGSARVTGLVDRLDAELCRPAGFSCDRIAFRTRRIADLVGTPVVDQREATVLARLSDHRLPVIERVGTDGAVLAVIPVNGRAAGVLLARPLEDPASLGDDELDLIEALASGLGDMVNRVRLEDTSRRATRKAEFSASRDRIARDLDEHVGSGLRTLWQALADMTPAAPPELKDDLGRLRDEAGQLMLRLHLAAAAFAALQVRETGLARALRLLLRSFEAATEIPTVLRVDDHLDALDGTAAEAIHEVVFEALALEHDARANVVIVSVAFDADGDIKVVVRDDGIPLSQRRAAVSLGVHHTVSSIRTRLAAHGGQLTLSSASPRGVRLEARLPRLERGRSTGRPAPRPAIAGPGVAAGRPATGIRIRE